MTAPAPRTAAWLDALADTHAKATKGPWEWDHTPGGDWGHQPPDLVTVAKLPPYADGSVSPVGTVISSWGHDADGVSVSDEDAAAIVAAHNAMPELIAALRGVLALAGELDGGSPCDSGEHGPACNWDAADRIRSTVAALAGPHTADEEADRG